mgnify:CR=1 FL=1
MGYLLDSALETFKFNGLLARLRLGNSEIQWGYRLAGNDGLIKIHIPCPIAVFGYRNYSRAHNEEECTRWYQRLIVRRADVFTVGISYKLGDSNSSMAICETHIRGEQVTGSWDLIDLGPGKPRRLGKNPSPPYSK